MAAPSLIGSTYRNSGLAVAINAVSWTFVSDVTVDDSFATFVSDNDGSIPNDSGEGRYLEGVFFFGTIMTTTVDVLFSVGIYDGVSWTPAPADHDMLNQDIGKDYGMMIPYKVFVPAGHKVGLLAKTISGTTTQYAQWLYHFAKSSDGSAEPKLSVSCTQTGIGGIGTDLPPNYRSFRGTTTEYTGAVGGLSDASRITNTTDETLVVDGFWFCLGYFNLSFTRGLTTTSSKNGEYPDSVPAGVITDASVQDRTTGSGNDWNSFFGWYVAELAPGDYMEMSYILSAATSFNYTFYSFQHSMRSRT